MKLIVASLVLAGSFVVIAASEASAWYCRADSPSAYGWATSSSQNAARRGALRQCAVRTPRRQTCYITSCR